MTCEHLRPLEEAILACNIRETFRGAACLQDCREWVHFDCFLDLLALREVFDLADCVIEHCHRGTQDGQQRGFVCTACNDAILGRYAKTGNIATFAGLSLEQEAR